MKRTLTTSLGAVLAFTLLLGVLYPLAMTGIGQVAFPGNANGQQIRLGGRLVGSRIIGQSFTDVVRRGGRRVTVANPGYFQSRPSATTPPDNAAATASSNLGPNDLATERSIQAAARAYLALNRPYDHRLTIAAIPVDAVTTSASGIDPDISPANAAIQARRVAAVRRLPLRSVISLIDRYTSGRALGFAGEPAVNVLELNLALDRATDTRDAR